MRSRVSTGTIIYGILTVTILIPLLSGKYLFLLDFIPKVNGHKAFDIFYGKIVPEYGGILPLNLLPLLLTPEVSQKIIIFSILFFGGYSMYYLAGIMSFSRTSRFYAGFLYMLNPYTYVRVIIGHWMILFSYAILPLAMRYFIELLDKKDIKNILKTVLVTSLVAFNAHTLFIAFLVFLILLLLKIYEEKLSLAKPVIVGFIIFIFLNLYWIVPLITANKEMVMAHISAEDLAIFAPRIESFSALFTLASMHGFWRPGYIYAKDFIPFWQLLFVIILFLAVHGFVSYYRDEKIGKYVKAFGLIWLVGLILAAGIRSPFSEQFRFLFDHIPLLKGMRDSHKFVTMLVLSYSFLGALGLSDIEKSLEKRKPIIRKAVIILILLVPLIYSFTFFNGFAGQIKPTDYPKDWYEVNEFLNEDKDDFKVLFFPWHLKMNFHWIKNKDKRIGNPSSHFFNKEVISGLNIEVGAIYRQIYTPYQLYIDNLLRKRKEINNFGELVSILGVKYILLTKEVDYRNYFFLFNQSDLKLVKETENFYVFENKAFKGSIFSVNGIDYVKDWNGLINVSKTEDITEKLYLIGNGKKEGNEGYKKIEYEKISPAKYVIKDKPLKYIILTEEYSEDWKLDGKEPMKAYGVVNAYLADNQKEIVYERFYRICLPSYIISLVTFVGCIGYLFYGWKK